MNRLSELKSVNVKGKLQNTSDVSQIENVNNETNNNFDDSNRLILHFKDVT
jgi:hypothetical protein